VTATEGRQPFTLQDARSALASACKISGLAAEGAELIRLGENVLFRLATEPVVVRIGRGVQVLADAEKEVAVASWLRDAGLPAAEHTGHRQPVVAETRPVTFWKLIDDSGVRPTVSDLAGILRRLHSLPVCPDLDLPEFDIFGRVDERIAKAELPDDDLRFLSLRLSMLRRQYASVRFGLSPSAVHGDAHQANLIRRTDGEVLLIDFERFAFGPPETDLAVTATEYLIGWHTDADYASFCDAYGFDVTAWDGFPVIRAINELKMTTWLMQNAGESEEIATEFHNRLNSLHDDDAPRNWHPF
jgi:aminoglycoside phosphotransferase